MTTPDEIHPKTGKIEPPASGQEAPDRPAGATGRTLREAFEEVDAGPAIERTQADKLPEGDVVAILLERHAHIRDLFTDIAKATGAQREQLLENVTATLVAHEAAEQMILRPVARLTAGREEADSRDQEEEEIIRILSELEAIGTGDPEFDEKLSGLETAFIRHAEREEREEFPVVRAARSEDQLRRLGRVLRLVERFGPVHPHPEATGWLGGPLASLMDRARHALRSPEHSG